MGNGKDKTGTRERRWVWKNGNVWFFPLPIAYCPLPIFIRLVIMITMIILGIDPGLASTGFGALRCDGKKPVLVKCGAIKTFTSDTIPNRLMQIHADINSIIDQVGPDLVAIEDVFSLVRYPRAGILLGSVLGVLYVAARGRGLPVQEIAPKEIKNALVGFGNAGKKQIKEAVASMLGIGNISSFHASDALAAALAVYYRREYKAVI